MQCLFCKQSETEVIETRTSENRSAVRRRRVCTSCKKRFTTYERAEDMPIFVIKRDGRRERFDREKIRSGIIRSVEKTTVSAEDAERIVDMVTTDIAQEGQEIESQQIGRLVAQSLKSVDKVAYIRFASVFRRFVDVEDFERELKKLL